MAKAVILKTNEGVMLTGNFQCSNGVWFDAEGCFNYCNTNTTEALNKHQMHKLINNATLLGHQPITEPDWYKHRKNFIDVEIPYTDVIQEYQTPKE